MLYLMRISYLALMISLASHATEEKADPSRYLLTKSQLQCLYAQVEGLLSEKADPSVIFLSEELCQSSTTPLKSEGGERTDLPGVKPSVNPADAKMLKPEEVLVLNKAQLACFKQQFAALIKQEKEPISMIFPEKCTTQEAR